MSAPEPKKPAPPNPALHFERRVAKVIRDYGSLTVAAKETGIPISTLFRFSVGQHLPDFISLWRFGDAGVDLNWLITGRKKGK